MTIRRGEIHIAGGADHLAAVVRDHGEGNAPALRLFFEAVLDQGAHLREVARLRDGDVAPEFLITAEGVEEGLRMIRSQGNERDTSSPKRERSEIEPVDFPRGIHGRRSSSRCRCLASSSSMLGTRTTLQPPRSPA